MLKTDNYPKYSVLMSVYYKETAENLKKSIESMLNQTILCDEFVLVKDGPLTKELEEIIDAFVQKTSNLFKVVSLKTNQGLGPALKIGVKNCKNEWIARADSDDISVKERMAKQFEKLNEDPNLDIIGSNHIEFTDSPTNKQIFSYKNLPITDEEIKIYAKRRNPFSHSVITMRKSKVLEAGNYRKYHLVEDYDLWVRMICKNANCINVNEYLSYVYVSRDLYKRRGGIKYLKSILKFKNELYKNNFYSLKDYIISTTSHITVCLMPGFIRKFIYKKFLRKEQ